MKPLTKYILSEYGGKTVRRVSLETVCKRFWANTTNTINFMISYGYMVRLLRGLYYVRTVEEFTLKKAVDIYKMLSLGMDELKIKWYFGLYTALRFNGVTHEFSDTIFIVNEKIFRPKVVKVAKEKVRFLKLSPTLFSFGILEKNGAKSSDLEKTLLDIIYLSKYRSVPEERIISSIEDYSKGAKNKKIREYLKFYPKSVGRVVGNAGLI